MEFACNIPGAKLILVLGHTYCGAIKAACEDVKFGYLSKLLDKIKPAVNYVAEKLGLKDGYNKQFLKEVTVQNVQNTMTHVFSSSDAIRTLITDKSIGLIGAVYDVE